MAVLKCKMCGGNLDVQEGMTICECEYCGSMQTVPRVDDEKKITLFARANRLREACEFDKAFGVYESIVTEFQDEAEAYWGLVLCKYGIEYVDDPKTGRKIPTCHRSSFDSVFEDSNYGMVMNYASLMAQKVYIEEAETIEKIRERIIEVSSKEEPYDVFICYKESDENGERTIDSVLAQEVYDELTDKGYKAFFARISLEDKLGQEYEPYIFAALNSAKVMLVFGTKNEYFDAVWVKNEWSRFLNLIERGERKILIPCYKNMDAYDMPIEFKRLQAQDLGKIGAIQDILRGIGKIIETKKPVVETVAIKGGNGLTKRGYMYLEDEMFDKAADYFERALDDNPEDGDAYLGKVLTRAKVHRIEDLESMNWFELNDGEYEKAIRFSEDKQKKRLLDILQERQKKIDSCRDCIKKILNSNNEELLTSVPLLKDIIKELDDEEIETVLGVKRPEIDPVLTKYEVYKVLTESDKPLRTKEIILQSPMLSTVEIDSIKAALVDLNNTGLLDFRDSYFYLASDEYKSRRIAEIEDERRERIEVDERELATISCRMAEIPGEIDKARSSSDDSIIEKRNSTNAEIDEIRKELQAEKSRINPQIESVSAEVARLETQIENNKGKLLGLGLFSGKIKKQILAENEALEYDIRKESDTLQRLQKEYKVFSDPRYDRIRMLTEIEESLRKPEEMVQALEKELSGATQRSEYLKNEIETLKQNGWAPSIIDIDYDEGDDIAYKFLMRIDKVRDELGRGTVVTGTIMIDEVAPNMHVRIIHNNQSSILATIKEIRCNEHVVPRALKGNTVELLCGGVNYNLVYKGDDIALLDEKTATTNIVKYVDVELANAGTAQVAVIKTIREIFGLGLAEAKEIVDTVPVIIKSNVPMDEAIRLKRKIEGVSGGTIINIR